jgi:TetR/AcrR family transcriptional regulator
MDRPVAKPSIREINERAILASAETVFAERGYAGATMSVIAARAGSPKANIHYYFPTKEVLYRAVVERVLTAWLDAAQSFDLSDDPVEALTGYINAKMDLAREMPLSSQIYASEIMRGAPVVQDYLETTLREWVEARSGVVQRWIAEGKLRPLQPKYLFYMIWATTQHYANAAHEVATLAGGEALTTQAFEQAKRQVVETVLFGVANPR